MASSISNPLHGAGLRAGAGLALALVLAASPVPAAVVRDAVGRTVDVPSAPRRIVSLAPNLTEILFALGLGDNVAGVTLFCDWPPEALAKPKVGGFVNPSLEAILALGPDLVLATADGNRPDDVRALERLGIAVYTVDTRSLGEVLATIETVGSLAGSPKRARALAADLARRRDAVRAAIAALPAVTVFVALDGTPLISAADGTFVGELIALAGGRNIVGDSPIKYPVVNMEHLLAEDPAVILDATGSGSRDPGEAAVRWRARPGAASLRAVRDGRILAVGEGSFFRPGPRIVDSLETLARFLHPEVAPR
jgi:iron complex transport system substrate-binding protein